MGRMKMEYDLTIQQVSDRLGLPKSTLRYWEKELCEHIQPKRTSGGQRRYDMGDINFFQRVLKMKNKGLSLREIKHDMQNSSAQKSTMNDQHDLSVELLAKRIAALVKQEITMYLSGGKKI